MGIFSADELGAAEVEVLTNAKSILEKLGLETNNIQRAIDRVLSESQDPSEGLMSNRYAEAHGQTKDDEGQTGLWKGPGGW